MIMGQILLNINHLTLMNQYIILMDNESGGDTHLHKASVIIVSGKRTQLDLSNIQAQSKYSNGCPIQRQQTDTKYENSLKEVILRCFQQSCEFYCRYKKRQSSMGQEEYDVIQENLCHSCNYCRAQPKEPLSLSKQRIPSIKGLNTWYGGDSEQLYCIDEINLLKKQMEFESKGMLSKSTQFNESKNLITLIRFKCKNFPTNICPFQHVFQYRDKIDGKAFYSSRSLCSVHISDCLLDNDQVQENVITRKIDSSNKILTEIIKKDPDAKPKTILQMLASELGQENQNFLYEGLVEKNMRRSMKKYFDNAVAKIKNRIKSQSASD